MAPTPLILRTAGTNCDQELAHAFALAGARPQIAHLNELIADPTPFERCDFIALPGGFSYGDDIAAGRIFANRLKHQLAQPLHAAIARGVGVLGICNGFQVLVKLGLLPDPQTGKQTVTLAENTAGRFVDRWVKLDVNDQSPCLWTQGLAASIDLPIAHAEGRLTAADATLDALEANHQVPLRYAADDDPNGSKRRIAGLCDPTGRVFGLMPHPERCINVTHRPDWRNAHADAEPIGLQIIKNGVQRIASSAAASQNPRHAVS
jgi:phosphoribosylformylglycinamidine synthase